MKHLRYWTYTFLAAAAVLLPTYACGPDFPSAVFVLPDAPDGDYSGFAAGHLGVLQPGFHSRSLALAYRVLTGPPLTPAEQTAAESANDHFLHPEGPRYDPSKLPPPPPGFDAWIQARNSFGAVDGYSPDGSLPNQLTNNYEDITKCLDPAFAKAAATLAARMREHGQRDPAVTEWVRGQDAVFTNCGDGKAPPYFGPGQPPPPPPAPRLPAKLTGAPLWLEQDRAYQQAAAQFYAGHYDDALNRFRAIAQDTASPWSTLARYVQARVLIRKAAFVPQPQDDGSGTPLTDEQRQVRQADFQKQREQAADQRTADLELARKSLLAMQNEPQLASMREAIDGLLDYVNARLDPDRQAVTLARRILTPGQQRLQQTLIDFTALHTTGAFGELSLGQPATPQQMAAKQAQLASLASSNDTTLRGAADLAAWVDVLNEKDGKAALSHWHMTPTTPWLVAALTFAQPSDRDATALIAAARAISETDPAWLTVTYHRLRLTPASDETRAEVNAILPRLRRTEGPSAINLFTTLAAAHAPTLQEWLAHAGRSPAGESDDYEAGVQPYTEPKETVCGHPSKGFQLFDTDAAVAFNRQLPLRLLADAAESSALPENLRFQVAQAALTRAILLDQPAIANRMAPILEACRAAWKPVLDAYAAAQKAGRNAADLHAAGLFALMRFASTEPSVREGEERRSGFATYDDMRENWWCSTVPLPTGSVDEEPPAWRKGGNPDAVPGSDPAGMTTHPHVAPAPPAFLTPADLAQARAEVASLEALPNASSYFAQQAIAWFHAHPTDPRTPEILGQADRVVRNSCRHDPEYGKLAGPDSTATYAHTIFDLLHQNYPKSPWTLRYKTWE